MINSPFILDGISAILIENIEKLSSTHPDLKFSGCELGSKSVIIENFEFFEGSKKINQVYSRGKLEILIHPSGKKVKGSYLESLIQMISFRLFLDGWEPVSFYKWESKKSLCFLKKEDRIDLLAQCDISQAIEKTLEDIIFIELPKFRGRSKEKSISEDQLSKISSFNVHGLSGAI